MKKIALFLSFLTFVFLGCNQQSENFEVSETGLDIKDAEISDKNMVSQKNEINLPSPLRIIQLFNNSGLKYESNLTNDIQNLENYTTKFNQKLNFGIYTADLSYCVLNEQKQSSLKYLKTLKQLSQTLWKRDIFSTVDIGRSIENNIKDKEELLTILSNFQLEMDEYLEMNGVVLTGSYVFAGAWVEIMYVGLEVSKINSNPKLKKALKSQPYVLESLLEIFNQNVDILNDNGLIFKKELENINRILLEAINLMDNGEVLQVDNKVEELRKNVFDLRTKIVSGNSL